MATQTAPTLRDIEEARERLAGVARVTPVYGSETLSRLAGREVWLKAENLQRTGSFKVRGAVNRIATLDDERARGGRRRGERRQPRPGGRVGRARGRRRARASTCRSTRRWRRSRRARTTAPSSSSRASASRTRWPPRGRTSRRPARRSSTRSRTSASIAGQGTIGLELAEQVPDGRDRRSSPSAAAGSRRASRLALRAVKPDVRIVGVQARQDRLHDRGRDLRQAPRRADDEHPRRAARRHGPRRGRGDQRGDRAAARAVEARRRGRGRRRRRGAARGQGRRRGAGRGRPLRREHRPDAADLGDAARPHASPAATSSCARASRTGPAS